MEENQKFLEDVLEKIQIRLTELEKSMEAGKREVEAMHEITSRHCLPRSMQMPKNTACMSVIKGLWIPHILVVWILSMRARTNLKYSILESAAFLQKRVVCR